MLITLTSPANKYVKTTRTIRGEHRRSVRRAIAKLPQFSREPFIFKVDSCSVTGAIFSPHMKLLATVRTSRPMI